MRQEGSRRRNPGVSLPEVIVALFVFTLGWFFIAKFFNNSSSSFMATRNRSIAIGLLNERFASMKENLFDFIAVSTALVPIPDLPSETYDPANYPRVERTDQNTLYAFHFRADRILRDGSNQLVLLPPNAESTLKRVTGVVTWREGGRVKSHTQERVFSSALENFTELDPPTLYEGVVRSTDGVPLAGTHVFVDYIFGAVADENGRYRIEGYPGPPTTGLTASRPNDYMGDYSFSANPVIISTTSSPVIIDLRLYKSITADFVFPLWKNRKLMIANVMGKYTYTYLSVPYELEYLSVVNFTTYTWNVQDLGLLFQRAPGTSASGEDPAPIPIDVDYNVAVSSVILPGKFALFASTPVCKTNLIYFKPHAYWNVTRSTTNLANFGSSARRTGNTVFTAANPNIIPVYEDDFVTNREGVGSIALIDKRTNQVLDAVGWVGSGAAPGQMKGSPFADSIPEGLRALDNLERRASPPPGVNQYLRLPVWDSRNNAIDFLRTQTAFTQACSYEQTQALAFVVGETGLPASGTVQLFTSVATYEAPVTLSTTTPPFLQAEFPNAYRRSFYGVEEYIYRYQDGAYSYIAYSHAMPGVDNFYASLYFYKAHIRMQSGSPYPGMLYLANCGGKTCWRQVDHVNKDLIAITTAPFATLDITFDGNLNTSVATKGPWYASLVQGWNVVTLPDANTLKGRVTARGGAGVPNVPIQAESGATDWKNVGVTDTNGDFRIIVPSFSTYKITPIMNQFTFSPPDHDCLVTGSGETFSTTFQMIPSNTLESLSGTLRAAGRPIESPVSLCVTTCTITEMPVMDQALRLGTEKYFTGSNREDGSFSIRVPPGTGYYLYGWYAAPPGAPPVMKKAGPVAVPVDGEASGVDLNW